MKLSAKLQGGLSSASGSSGAVGASQLTLLFSLPVATLAGAMGCGILGCAATLCPGTPPGTAMLQGQGFWRAGAQEGA